MVSEQNELLQIILREIKRIKQGSEKIRPLSNAKADMGAAISSQNLMLVNGTSHSDSEVLEMAKALLPVPKNLSPKEAAIELKKRSEVSSKLGGEVRKEFDTAKKRELFARARYAISYLHHNGFSLAQMEEMVRRPGKRFLFPKKPKIALKFVKLRPQIRIKR